MVVQMVGSEGELNYFIWHFSAFVSTVLYAESYVNDITFRARRILKRSAKSCSIETS